MDFSFLFVCLVFPSVSNVTRHQAIAYQLESAGVHFLKPLQQFGALVR